MKESREKEKKRRRRKKQKGVGREENSAMSTVPCGIIVRSIHSHHKQDKGVDIVTRVVMLNAYGYAHNPSTPSSL